MQWPVLLLYCNGSILICEGGQDATLFSSLAPVHPFHLPCWAGHPASRLWERACPLWKAFFCLVLARYWSFPSVAFLLWQYTKCKRGSFDCLFSRKWEYALPKTHNFIQYQSQETWLYINWLNHPVPSICLKVFAKYSRLEDGKSLWSFPYRNCICVFELVRHFKGPEG